MGWLASHEWIWLLIAGILGALVTWFLSVRRFTTETVTERTIPDPVPAPAPATPSPAFAAAPVPEPEPVVEPEPEPVVEPEPEPVAFAPEPEFVEAAPEADLEPAESTYSSSAAAYAPTAAEVVAEDPIVAAEPEPVIEPEPVVEPEPVAFAAAAVTETHGPGSAAPLEGGAAPSDAFTIKGNDDSGLFHTVESPYYGRTKAEVWFDTEDNAVAAGFVKWNERVREKESEPVAFVAPVITETHGPGSAAPLEGGAAPSDAFTIKGNDDSGLFHTVDSPYYGRTKAEVWFDTEDNAVAAGFVRWDRKHAATGGEEEVVETATFAAIPDGRFGPGSAEPLEDGSAPSDAFTIKGNDDSGLFHTVESPYYGRTKAEVWFDTEDNAVAAGFVRWDRKHAATETATFAAIPDGPYGPGSADPLDGGASPGDAFTIKGNADSMLFHTVESPYYGRTKAEVWFDSEAAAKTAGFTRWDEN